MSNLTQFVGGAIKSIQRGTISLADSSGTSGTSTVTAVDTAKSELRYLGSNRGGSAQDATLVLTNTTTITASRAAATGALVVSWELTEFF